MAPEVFRHEPYNTKVLRARLSAISHPSLQPALFVPRTLVQPRFETVLRKPAFSVLFCVSCHMCKSGSVADQIQAALFAVAAWKSCRGAHACAGGCVRVLNDCIRAV
jgi:hypothetical protein